MQARVANGAAMTAPALKPEKDNDGQLELAVLVRMLFDDDDAVYLADQLVPDDFITDTARAFFVLLASLASTGKATDPVSVGVRLRTDGTPALLELYDTIITYEIGADEDYMVGTIALVAAFKEWSYAERFKQIITGAALALTLGKPTAKIERRVEERMIALQSSARNDRVFDDRKKQTIEVVDYYADRGKYVGLTFGIEKIDREVLPIRSGNLFVIGGRQKAGKSTVVRNFYGHWSRTEKGVVFSLEMSSLEQWVNLACMASGVAVTAFYRGTMTPEQERAFGVAMGHLQKNENLIVNDRAHLTPERCLRAMSRYLAEGCTWFVLDHLHRFDYGESKDSDLRIPVGNFVRDLKNFAMTNKVKIIALSQLKQGSVHDQPDESSYRETSKIGEEIDGSFFCYKPLVACDPMPDGTLRPITKPDGGRLFAHEKKPKEAVMGVDEENIYLAPANFRIAPSTVLFKVPFNKATGKLINEHRYGVV
jgi:replicative DNA helicase